MVLDRNLACDPPSELRPSVLRATRGGETAALGLVVRGTRRHRGFAHPGLSLNATGVPSWDRITIEHNGLLCMPSDEPEIMAELVGWFAGEMRELDELRLDGVMQPVADATLAAAGLPAETRTVPGCLVDLAELRGAGDDVLPWVGSATRQRLRRVLRDYGRRGGLGITEARNLEEALAFFAAMKALHIASWAWRKRRHAFVEPYFECFHRALIERSFAAGDEAIGYLYNFRHRGRISAYQSGFADDDRRLSPGLACHYLALRHNAGQGVLVYDFLAGESRLKAGFATATYPLSWQSIRKPRLTTASKLRPGAGSGGSSGRRGSPTGRRISRSVS